MHIVYIVMPVPFTCSGVRCNDDVQADYLVLTLSCALKEMRRSMAINSGAVITAALWEKWKVSFCLTS
jgi:hypothetical protein